MRPLPNISDIDRLLIVKTSSIGDVVHALPVVEQIKKANSRLVLGWLVKERCKGVLEGNPWIDHLHIIPRSLSYSAFRQLSHEVREIRYQCALDMQGLFLSGAWTWLSSAPVRIGIDRNREGNRCFLTHAVVAGKPCVDGVDRHAVDILFGFADALGVHGDHTDFAPQCYLADGNSATVHAVADLRGPSGVLVALNVGASSRYKQWPTEHWAALARYLLEYRICLLFVGDRRDAEQVAAVKAQLPDDSAVLDLSGQTSLRQLAAALQECDVVVTGDTGPMHLAVAVGTPTVALFGSTNPVRTGPYGRRNIVLDRHLSCSPCYRKPTCDGRVDCMQTILPAEAFLAVRETLASAGKWPS